MIPAFNDDGYLPPGIHRASLQEVEERFGRLSEVRHAQVESLTWLIDLARRAGVERLVINGSFVTDLAEPNDLDCVLLVGLGFPLDVAAEKEILTGLPFLQVDIVDHAGFDEFVGTVYATDRSWTPKGMIEVVL